MGFAGRYLAGHVRRHQRGADRVSRRLCRHRRIARTGQGARRYQGGHPALSRQPVRQSRAGRGRNLSRSIAVERRATAQAQAYRSQYGLEGEATMSIADTTENAVLNLVFRAVAWALYADNAGTTPQTNIGISLHTADPGDAGTASTSEVGYTSYTRVNVARTTGGWSPASGGSISPAANIDFPTGTGGSGTVTHFATAASNATPPTGAQVLLWSGTVTPNIVTGTGVTPRLTTATTIPL